MSMRIIKVDKSTKGMLDALTAVGCKYIWKWIHIYKKKYICNCEQKESLCDGKNETQIQGTAAILKGNLRQRRQRTKKMRHPKWKQYCNVETKGEQRLTQK